MNKKIIAITIIFLLVFFGGYYNIEKILPKSKVELKTSTVKQGTLKISFDIDGKTTIERRDLKFKVSGKVSNVNVKEGQTVKKGQLLMSLDTTDVKKNLEKDLKDYLITRNSFDQTTQVTYRDQAITDSIKRILENTQYTLDKSVLDVEIQNEVLKESRLYSPIAGIVSFLNIKDGEVVNTQNTNPIVIITVPGSLTFEAYAEDTDILKINKDQKTAVKIDALPNITFESQIDYISNLATIDSNGLASYKVKATMSNLGDYNILDGMSGRIEFITKEKSGIMIIPNTAVIRKDNKSYVNKLEDGITQETQIETGFTDGKEVEIVSGLNISDRVLLP